MKQQSTFMAIQSVAAKHKTNNEPMRPRKKGVLQREENNSNKCVRYSSVVDKTRTPLCMGCSQVYQMQYSCNCMR